MKKGIFTQDYSEDQITNSLFNFLYNKLEYEIGYIYYDFPIVKEMDHPVIKPNIFLISPDYGVVLIVCDDISTERNNQIKRIYEKSNRIDTFIYTSLLKQVSLQKDLRTLKFQVTSFLYLPNIDSIRDNNTFNSKTELLNALIRLKGNIGNLNEDSIAEVLAVLEATSATIKPKERYIEEEDTSSRAYVLKNIEGQIAKFDDSQRAAALTMLEGPQRIRGLAGSGKTIILCLKAAYLHLEQPDKKILYTFYTRSLYDYIQQLITRFYSKLTDGSTPDFINKINILHAWGGNRLPGVYYMACKGNSIAPIDFSTAKNQSDNPFDYVCNEFINATQYKSKKLYDYILMDEAQDYNPSFYQLCRSIVKDDHLIWCYDELQNIFNVQIQNTSETFKNSYDPKGIDLNEKRKKLAELSNDIVLPKSYRNHKRILTTAIAIGFGIYNGKLIQSLENNNHWEDLGFKVLRGDCSIENEVEIERKEDCSPLNIKTDNYSDFIVLFSAINFDDEIKWVVEEIEDAINNGKLLPDDIAVISLDDRNASLYFKHISIELGKKGISCNNILSKSYVKGFNLDNCVTLSSVYKAKGNEAAMVFVIGCDVFENEKNLRSMRNRIFTSFTRAKVWLRVSGINLEESSLQREMLTLKDKDFKYIFMNKPTHLLDRDWNEFSKRYETEESFYNELLELAAEKGLDRNQVLEIIKRKHTNEEDKK